LVVDRVHGDHDRSRSEQEPAEKRHGAGQNQGQSGGPRSPGVARHGDPNGDHAEHQHSHVGVNKKDGIVQQAVTAEEHGQLGVELGQPLPASRWHLGG